MKTKIILTVYFLIASASLTFCQKILYVDSIPMRDGKKLACDVHLPDTSGGQKYPTILIQTPYDRTLYQHILPMGIPDIDSSHYAIVAVDWRGKHGSIGAWIPQINLGEDGYDCVEWIAQQSWSDGKVGTWGASALGRVQYSTAKENPPHLVCCAPLVAASQYKYKEYYSGGVLRTEYVQQLDSLGFGLGAAVYAHPIHDWFWNYCDTAYMYPEKIYVPMFLIGGWYDHNIDVMFEVFDSLRLYSPLNVRNKHRMLFGPWTHVGLGGYQQGQLLYPQAAGWSDSLALRFFDYYLRNIPNGWDTTQFIKFFQMGQDTWHNSASWPPSGTTSYKLYFSNGMLTTQLPQATSDSCNIVYDPKDPSPTIGGPTLRHDLEQGPYDQAPLVESRNDIQIFSSATLVSDVVMKGKATVHLFVRTNRKDTDFSIRLTDVYPDGRSMILSDGIKRLRFRKGYTAIDTLVASPDSIYHITIDLPDLANTFLTGHEIRVDLTSSNYPRFDCNLNNGGVMYAAGDTLIATNTIYTNNIYASYIELPLIDFTSNATETNFKTIDLSVFPNPFTNQISILPNIDDSFSNIDITDITGRAVRSFSKVICRHGKPIVMDLHELATGIYILKAKDLKQKKTYQCKIIKNK